MNRNARSALHQRRRNIDRHAKATPAVEFFNVLTSPELLDTAEAQLPEHRERLYPPTVTLSMFMRQVLDADGSCQKVVNGWAAQRAADGRQGHQVDPERAEPAGFAQALPRAVRTRRIKRWRIARAFAYGYKRNVDLGHVMAPLFSTQHRRQVRIALGHRADTRVRQTETDGVYVIEVDGYDYVKILHRDFASGGLQILSFDQAYRPQTVTAGRLGACAAEEASAATREKTVHRGAPRSLAVVELTLLKWVKAERQGKLKGAGSKVVSAEQISALFDRWNTSLGTLDPDQVVAQYAPDAVLLPTVSNRPRTTPADMRDYFVYFLKSSPQGKIDQHIVRIGCNVAQDVGTYTFRLKGGKTVHARYTYVYEWVDGKWLIAHHHSSAMPEPVVAKK